MNTDRFENLYQERLDPWNYCSSLYEQEKYMTTLKALPKKHYENGLEVGCSIGILTQHLAQYCQNIMGIDCSPTALKQAQKNCLHNENVSFLLATLPEEWPKGTFDLIVFSEVLYYFPRHIIRLLADKAANSLAAGGDCVVVNYRQPIDEAVQGDEASAIFKQAFYGGKLSYKPITIERKNYRIDVLKLED